jgi:hypothetical protein
MLSLGEPTFKKKFGIVVILNKLLDEEWVHLNYNQVLISMKKTFRSVKGYKIACNINS